MTGKIVIPDSTQALGDFDPSNPAFIIAAAQLWRHYSLNVGGAVAITSITRVTTTATVTVASTAALTSGDTIYISGSDQADYNGRKVITVVDATTFTFTVANAPTTPATGTMTYSTTGYSRWLFGPSQATASSARISLCEDYDQGIPFRFHDGMVKSLSLGATPNTNLAVALAMVFGEFSLHGAVTQTAGSGSTLPIYTKFWSGNLDPDATDSDIYHKIIAAAAFTMRAKIGAGSSYDTVHSADAYVLGQFNRLYNEQVDEVDRIIGDVSEQIRAYMPVGASLTTGDIFHVLKRIASWSQTLGVQRPISSVNVSFILNGNEIKMSGGWQLEMVASDVLRIDDVYGRQSADTRLSGQVTATIKPTREIADRDLQNVLLLGTTLPVVIDAPVKTEIGVSGMMFRGRAVLPAVKFAGNSFSPTAGGKDRKEALTGTAGVPDAAYTYDGSSWADACTIELRNDQTAAVLAT